MLATKTPPLPDAAEGQTHTIECADCRGYGGNDQDGECASCRGMGKVDTLVDAFNCLCDACAFAYWVDLGDSTPKLRFRDLGRAMHACPQGTGVITKRTSRLSRIHGPVFGESGRVNS